MPCWNHLCHDLSIYRVSPSSHPNVLMHLALWFLISHIWRTEGKGVIYCLIGEPCFKPDSSPTRACWWDTSTHSLSWSPMQNSGYLDEWLAGSEDEATSRTEPDTPHVAEMFVQCQELSTCLQIPYLHCAVWRGRGEEEEGSLSTQNLYRIHKNKVVCYYKNQQRSSRNAHLEKHWRGSVVWQTHTARQRNGHKQCGCRWGACCWACVGQLSLLAMIPCCREKKPNCMGHETRHTINLFSTSALIPSSHSIMRCRHWVGQMWKWRTKLPALSPEPTICA